MEMAVFPTDHSEELGSVLRAVGATILPMAEISPELPGEAEALIVELGDEPLRRLRQLETLATESAVPVLVVIDPRPASVAGHGRGSDRLRPDPARPGRGAAQAATADPGGRHR